MTSLRWELRVRLTVEPRLETWDISSREPLAITAVDRNSCMEGGREDVEGGREIQGIQVEGKRGSPAGRKAERSRL